MSPCNEVLLPDGKPNLPGHQVDHVIRTGVHLQLVLQDNATVAYIENLSYEVTSQLGTLNFEYVYKEVYMIEIALGAHLNSASRGE